MNPDGKAVSLTSMMPYRRMRAGDVLRLVAPSGDCYGPPFERSPERVRQDVILGLVDVDAAREQYCVALGPAPEYEVDAAVMRALRAAARSNAISEDDR